MHGAPERIWTSLRAQLEQEGLIREAIRQARKADRAPRAGWFDGIFAAAAAPGAGGRLSGGAGRRGVRAELVPSTGASTKPLARRHADFHLAAERAARYRRARSVSYVSAFQSRRDCFPASRIWLSLTTTSLCVKKAYSEEPENEVARDYLYEAYQQKADLLAQMTERGENGQ